MKKVEFKKKLKKFKRLEKIKISGKYLSIVDYFVAFRRDWEEELTAIDDFISQEISLTKKEMGQALRKKLIEMIRLRKNISYKSMEENKNEKLRNTWWEAYYMGAGDELSEILNIVNDIIDNYLERKK